MSSKHLKFLRCINHAGVLYMTIPPPSPPSPISEPLKKEEKQQQQVKLNQGSNTAARQEVEVVAATEKNPLKVEIRDHIRLHEAGEQLIFITSHMVPELCEIARERRNVCLILIDAGVRYFLRSVHIQRIETDGRRRMKCYYVNESASGPPN